MNSPLFDSFFTHTALSMLQRSIEFALDEDQTDLTTNAVFLEKNTMKAVLVAKEDTLLAGLPLMSYVVEATVARESGICELVPLVKEGSFLTKGTHAAILTGSTRVILRAERILLNYITHMSGIANLVAQYVRQLEGTGVRLLDTRKTLPGLRYPEKYAVVVGGGCNHRMNLGDLLMLKDNHVDAAGGITAAVQKLRAMNGNVIPIEVECRTVQEVQEAVQCKVFRIMLDNMPFSMMEESLELIPSSIEVELSGGVTLETIASLARVGQSRKADYISVGRLTHSAPSADFSLITYFN